jgi:hypothetical protein
VSRWAFVVAIGLAGCRARPGASPVPPQPPASDDDVANPDALPAPPRDPLTLPECEALTDLWKRCGADLEPNDRAALERDIDDTLAGWHAQAADPQAHRIIEEACRTTMLSLDSRCAPIDLPTPDAAAAADDPRLREPIGVPECDAYVQDSLTCADQRLPPEARAETRDAIATSAEAWRAVLAAPGTDRDELVRACTQAREAIVEPCGLVPTP